MKYLALVAAVPLLTCAAPPVLPQDQADLRCYIAFASLSGSDDKELQTAGAIGSHYFLGRIDGRSPKLDLESAMAAEAKHLSDSDIQGLLKSCEETFARRSDEVMKIGERLDKRGI